jgi:glucosamine--fructose-6-phosphate aminotransferase (isomerizing)
MHRQPDELRRLLSEEGWRQAALAAKLLRSARSVYLVGIGTSYHAALVGSWLLRAAGLDARAVSSFDFALYPEQFPIAASDAVVIQAHTGVKTYSAASLARAVEAKATVVSVGSLTAEHPGSRIILRTVEREQSAAYTASHLAAMTVLAQTATAIGEQMGAPGIEGFRAALDALPAQVADVLARQDEIAPVAELAVRGQVYAAGAGPNEATALELVIKAREAAYGRVDALAVEQFLHGPMVAFNAGDLAVLITVAGRGAGRVAEVAAVLAAMGGRLWLVGDHVPGVADATTFSLPELPEMLSPLLAVVPMQILAYQMAALKGTHPDTFRRDDPRYAAAFGLLKL